MGRREWLARWCFAMIGQRPSLRELSERDVALLYQAITAAQDRAKLSSDAQRQRHSDHKQIPVRKLGAQ